MKVDSSNKSGRELAIWIHPSGYELDWQETGEAADPKSLVRQEAFFAEHRRNWLSALYKLGFAPDSDGMSDSMRFWRGEDGAGNGAPDA